MPDDLPVVFASLRPGGSGSLGKWGSAHTDNLLFQVSWCSWKMWTNFWMHKAFPNLKRSCRSDDTSWGHLGGGWLRKCLLDPLRQKGSPFLRSTEGVLSWPLALKSACTLFLDSVSRPIKKGHLCLEACLLRYLMIFEVPAGRAILCCTLHLERPDKSFWTSSHNAASPQSLSCCTSVVPIFFGKSRTASQEDRKDMKISIANSESCSNNLNLVPTASVNVCDCVNLRLLLKTRKATVIFFKPRAVERSMRSTLSISRRKFWRQPNKPYP